MTVKSGAYFQQCAHAQATVSSSNTKGGKMTARASDHANILPFVFRKHALNCHRMKPALFNVLCEIKEKTGQSCFITYILFSIFLNYFFIFVVTPSYI